MTKITRLTQITTWKRALNAARRTVGKIPLDREPSDKWKARMLLAEHSPIRLVEYEWTWVDIPQRTTVHFVRHHIGCEKFVHTQRDDRNELVSNSDNLLQSAPNEMDMCANAQSIINISRKRLCSKASTNTRNAWKLVIDAIKEIDPILADKCVPECVYRGFCPEKEKCGYSDTESYKNRLITYRSV